MISSTPPFSAEIDISALTARLKLLEEENRWLKAQLFGRSSEKTPREDLHSAQGWLFNEAEALAAAEAAPTVTIPAHQRAKHGRKRLDAGLPRVDVIHDIAEDEKRCAADGTTLERIGEEISEQLDYQPAKIRVIRNIRPKYACPCCRQGIKIAPVPAMLFPKSMATPALLAQITTAKFVDHVPLSSGDAVCPLTGLPQRKAHSGAESLPMEARIRWHRPLGAGATIDPGADREWSCIARQT